MKMKVILEIISGICLVLGCLLYISYNLGYCKKRERLIAILSIIFTALGIGIIIGISNQPHISSVQEDNTEIIDDNIYENQIDP